MLTPEELNKQNKAILRRQEIAKLKPIGLDELLAVMHKWLIIPDNGIIKFLCAFYCANKIPGKALWAIIIGPSGGGKTQLLDAFLDTEDIYPISLLTPNTFLSGMPGKHDSSLLPKLSNKIALFKDWTSVLSMQKDAKAEIFSQFREIWDGDMKKVFGNGRIATWSGKVSILAASTQAVDLNQQQYTHLGERFLNYRMVMPDRKTVGMRSLENSSKSEQMENELKNAAYSFLLGLDMSPAAIEKLPEIPEEYKAQLVDLANFCTMARSGIIRDFGMKKDVIFVPTSEMPTRIVGQLSKLLKGLMMCNMGKFKKEDMEIVFKTALDSIPQTNKMVILEMAKADKQTTAEIATALGYPTEPIKIYLENLSMLRVCDRIKDGGKADRWTMKQEFVDIIRHYENVAELSEEEIRDRKDQAEDEHSSLDGWDDVPEEHRH